MADHHHGQCHEASMLRFPSPAGRISLARIGSSENGIGHRFQISRHSIRLAFSHSTVCLPLEYRISPFSEAKFPLAM